MDYQRFGPHLNMDSSKLAAAVSPVAAAARMAAMRRGRMWNTSGPLPSAFPSARAARMDMPACMQVEHCVG